MKMEELHRNMQWLKVIEMYKFWNFVIVRKQWWLCWRCHFSMWIAGQFLSLLGSYAGLLGAPILSNYKIPNLFRWSTEMQQSVSFEEEKRLESWNPLKLKLKSWVDPSKQVPLYVNNWNWLSVSLSLFWIVNRRFLNIKERVSGLLVRRSKYISELPLQRQNSSGYEAKIDPKQIFILYNWVMLH